MNNSNKQSRKTEDELFTLSFELKTLSQTINENKLERWVPGFSSKHTEEEHYNRYIWASKFVNRKKVLDIACGTGKGSLILSEKGGASQVVGCDIDKEVIRYASIKYPSPIIKYLTQNAEKFTSKNKFDVIISFETIEHIKKVDKFLTSIKSALKDDGILIVSTPISNKKINSHPDNEYHLCEWGFESFQSLISKHFKINGVYIQILPVPVPSIRNLRAYIKYILNTKQTSPQLDYLQVIPQSKQNIPIKKIGTDLPAYQILQCSKKK
ncbi:MAG: class I SAM-dependent methyltransferase [Patescibacteria group bacterium]|nr:class I SAM-dependent methyltransferase [Patescibacteria group bacterium]